MTLLESPLTVVKLLIAGFHPSDEDLSLGTPSFKLLVRRERPARVATHRLPFVSRAMAPTRSLASPVAWV